MEKPVNKKDSRLAAGILAEGAIRQVYNKPNSNNFIQKNLKRRWKPVYPGPCLAWIWESYDFPIYV